MHLRRMLELLQDVVPYIPKGKLYMGAWSRECGMPSCAGGWAAAHPSFEEQGLRKWPAPQSPGYVPALIREGGTFCAIGHAAMEKFFDLPSEYENYIFSGTTESNDTIDLACRIIDVIEGLTEGEVNYDSAELMKGNTDG